jgi:hypothetical protein
MVVWFHLKKKKQDLQRPPPDSYEFRSVYNIYVCSLTTEWFDHLPPSPKPWRHDGEGMFLTVNPPCHGIIKCSFSPRYNWTCRGGIGGSMPSLPTCNGYMDASPEVRVSQLYRIGVHFVELEELQLHV